MNYLKNVQKILKCCVYRLIVLPIAVAKITCLVNWNKRYLFNIQLNTADYYKQF